MNAERTLRERLLETMGAPKYRPMTRSELARHLEVPSDARSDLRAVLAELVKEGRITEAKKSRY